MLFISTESPKTLSFTMSEQHACDRKGNCKQHPQIRLRKRNPLGRWKTVVDSCPLCAVTHLCTIVRNINDECHAEPSQPHNVSSQQSLSKISMKHASKRVSMDSSISSNTVDTVSSSYSHSSQSSRRSHTSTSNASHHSLPQASRVVCGTPYVCFDTRRRGYYTGQVDAETGLPHGVGTLRFDDGSFSEGEWCNGRLSVSPTENSSRSNNYVVPSQNKTVRFDVQDQRKKDLGNSLLGDFHYNAAEPLEDKYCEPSIRSKNLTRSRQQKPSNNNKTVSFKLKDQVDLGNSLFGDDLNYDMNDECSSDDGDCDVSLPSTKSSSQSKKYSARECKETIRTKCVDPPGMDGLHLVRKSRMR